MSACIKKLKNYCQRVHYSKNCLPKCETILIIDYFAKNDTFSLMKGKACCEVTPLCAAFVCRRIENPRIVLLDCSLEYKKGESQVLYTKPIAFVINFVVHRYLFLHFVCKPLPFQV